MSISEIRVVPQDLRGKKLSVKSYCRGYVIAVIYLDKWHSAESSQSRDWEALSLLREEVTHVLL